MGVSGETGRHARRSPSTWCGPTAAALAFVVTARLDTPVEINYYRNGGILQTVLRKMLKG